MKLKIIMLLCLTRLLLCGCANIQLVDQTGRTLPNPHFILRSTSDLDIQTIFYYVKYKEIKDVDGSVVCEPKYLDFRDGQTFDLEDASCVVLIVEVRNPNRIKYKLWESVSSRYPTGMKFSKGLIGESNLIYRKFISQIPIYEGMQDVVYNLEMTTHKGDPIMNFGNFFYKIRRKHNVDIR